MIFVGIYAAVINLLGFLVMGYDKVMAKRHRRRIAEKDIMTLAALGAAVGIELGMRMFHHKTLHTKFVFGVPFLIITNLIMYGYVIYVFSTR